MTQIMWINLAVILNSITIILLGYIVHKHKKLLNDVVYCCNEMWVISENMEIIFNRINNKVNDKTKTKDTQSL
jgi:hypothetical protein